MTESNPNATNAQNTDENAAASTTFGEAREDAPQDSGTPEANSDEAVASQRDLPDDIPSDTHENGEQGYARAEDFLIERDGEGNLLAQETQCGQFGTVRIVPINLGDVKRLFTGRSDLSDEETVATILNEFFRRPNFEKELGRPVRPEDVDRMFPGVIEAVTEALFRVSKIDAEVQRNGQGETEVVMKNNGGN